MLPLLGLFFIVLCSYILIRVASVALEITGLSEEVANMQALSAFTGTGFTTTEAESVLRNPTRRNIIKILMIFGNAGLMTAVASLILTFTGNESQTNFLKFILLVTGMFLIFMIFQSKQTYYTLKKLSYKFLSRYDSLQVHDYHEVLGLGKGFGISTINIDDDSWMLGKQLKDLKLDREGTLILSIEKIEDGKKIFIGAPNGKTAIEEHDVLTCYGLPEAIRKLADRQSGYQGDACHQEQCSKLKEVEVIEEEFKKVA